MGLQPSLGAGNYLIKLFGLRRALKFCLALSLADPKHGIIAVGINGLCGVAHLVQQGKGMDNGKKPGRNSVG